MVFKSHVQATSFIWIFAFESRKKVCPKGIVSDFLQPNVEFEANQDEQRLSVALRGQLDINVESTCPQVTTPPDMG